MQFSFKKHVISAKLCAVFLYVYVYAMLVGLNNF